MHNYNKDAVYLNGLSTFFIQFIQKAFVTILKSHVLLDYHLIILSIIV